MSSFKLRLQVWKKNIRFVIFFRVTGKLSSDIHRFFFQAEKQGMREMMLNALEEKRKRLREEKDNENDIANGKVGGSYY